MTSDDPVRVLIAGGGVAALEAALTLRELAEGRMRVELLAPEPQFWYRPLAVAEPFGLGEVRHLDLSRLAADAGATLSHGKLISVDAARRLAYTSRGHALPYSVLLIACGALPRPAIKGALTFRGPADTPKIDRLLAELVAAEARRVAFAIPYGTVWSLPAYELALLTAAWLTARSITGVHLALVTPEDEPLRLFGREASDAVRALLDERGIALHTAAHAAEARPGELLLVGGSVVGVDRVVALPRLQGPRIGGVPQTSEGFIPVDRHGRVNGMADVYAAGDITRFPVKQGGLATQQAEAAAEAIAADAGLEVTPHPFRPVLRGLLLTGTEPRFLRASSPPAPATRRRPPPRWQALTRCGGRRQRSRDAASPRSSPRSQVPASRPSPARRQASPCRSRSTRVDERRREDLIEAAVEDALAGREVPRVGEVMSIDPLVVAPEDTLGEVADRMRERDTGAALVSDLPRHAPGGRRPRPFERGARPLMDDRRARRGLADNHARGGRDPDGRAQRPSSAGP